MIQASFEIYTVYIIVASALTVLFYFAKLSPVLISF